MARGENTGDHPNRKVPGERFKPPSTHVNIGHEFGVSKHGNFVPYLMGGHGPGPHWSLTPDAYPRAPDYGQRIEQFVPRKTLPFDGQFSGKKDPLGN